MVQFLLLRYTSTFDKHVVSPQGCFDNRTQDDDVSQGYEIFYQLAFSLQCSSILTQLFFNHHSRTYAGTFKLTAILSTIIVSLSLLVEHIETLSGWQPSRFPIMVSESYQLAISFAVAYQAIVYPGIPQTSASDEDIEL